MITGALIGHALDVQAGGDLVRSLNTGGAAVNAQRMLWKRGRLLMVASLVAGVAWGFAPGAALAVGGGSDIYWTNTGTNTIGEANLDGSDANPSFISGANASNGVAVNGKYIYWTDRGGPYAGDIARANLDGTAVNDSFITGASDPQQVVVSGKYIYWDNYTSGTIGRASLDGTAVNESFITIPKNSRGEDSAPVGVAVQGSYIYWGAYGQGAIGRANLDGAEVEPGFISGLARGASGIGGVYGIAVDAHYIYWSNGTIGRANLDGTGVDQNFINAGNAFEVAVDAQHIYWTNGSPYNSIGRADLNGANVDQSFITGADDPAAVAVPTAPLIVNSTGDQADNATNLANGVCNVNASAPVLCTLRAALQVVFHLKGGTISFDIPHDRTNTFDGATPEIKAPPNTLGIGDAPVTVDGTTQPGSGRVEIDGPGGDNTVGLWAPDAAPVTLRGLIIKGYAVALELGEFETVEGPTGALPPPGTVVVDPYDLRAYPEIGNVIQGNTFESTGNISFSTESGGLGNTPRDVTLRAALVILQGHGGQIGGGSPGQGDTFGGPLVEWDGKGDEIRGNTFLPGSDSGAEYNPGYAIALYAGGMNTIGGASTGDGNTGIGGIYLGENGDVVQANNDVFQMVIAGSDETIGGSASRPGEAPGNRIQGTGIDLGVQAAINLGLLEVVGGSHNVVQGNLIKGGGIALYDQTSTTIGGSSASIGNEISTTDRDIDGILLSSGRFKDGDGTLAPPPSSGNTIEHNQITGYGAGVLVQPAEPEVHEQLGISVDTPLAADEPVHDEISDDEMSGNGQAISFGTTFRYNQIDTVAGPNDYQFYPNVTSSSVSGRSATVEVVLDEPPSEAAETYTIELYGQGRCIDDSRTPGQGEHYLGDGTLTTGLTGKGALSLHVALPATSVSALTATATASNGDTSEFSPCLSLGQTRGS